VLLQKALLGSGREQVDTLERLLKTYEAIRDGGAVSSSQVEELEWELLQARIRVSQRETDYRDSLDQIKLRVSAGSEQLQKIEEAAVFPIARQLHRFEDLLKDDDTLKEALRKLDSPKRPPKLRSALGETFTHAALLRGTGLLTDLPGRWAAWEKRSDRELVPFPVGEFRVPGR
jgi:hypothetical protein